jgi:hypothetical protein
VLLHLDERFSMSSPPLIIGLPGLTRNIAVDTVRRVFGENDIEHAESFDNSTFELTR